MGANVSPALHAESIPPVGNSFAGRAIAEDQKIVDDFFSPGGVSGDDPVADEVQAKIAMAVISESTDSETFELTQGGARTNMVHYYLGHYLASKF